ncbi:MAG: CoA transferase [Chloroflexi bacterium]|nr:CoA transferase [Chloroflexota bacterium]
MAGALQGIRVLDLTEGIAGPYATGLMAGLGAEVVKIERPGPGDAARRWGPFPADRPHPQRSGLFLYLNGGKKSVTLDPASATGRRLLLRLAATADIVFHDDADALRLDELASRNPEGILVTVSPFGSSGPYAGYAGAEAVYQALCGLVYITGEPSREPLTVGVPLAQYSAGQLAFTAALTAYHHRPRGGRGQEVEVSLLEAATTVMEHAPAIWSYRKRVRRRLGNLGGLAGWGIYACRDGYVGVISGLGQAYESFLEWVGLTDPKFRAWAARTEHAGEMHAAIIAFLADRNKREVFQEAQGKGIPFGYVCTVADLAASPQLAAREFFPEVEQPAGGRLKLPGAPFLMSETPWRAAPAPTLGEHNAEVLCGELGISRPELGRLRQAGVV